MGKTVLINGSPRAPKSNSRLYSRVFEKNATDETVYIEAIKDNYEEAEKQIGSSDNLVFVFPLYADGVPAVLMEFMKKLEKSNIPGEKKPVVSVLINCGFLEFDQNNVAVRMIDFFCKKNGYKRGSTLKIGSGEAIMTSVFSFLAKRKIKKFTKSVCSGKYKEFTVTMPIRQKMFLKESRKYWVKYGMKYGTTEEEMSTMKIEGR